MKTVLIDTRFFELDSPISKGLVSGCKRLSEYLFQLICEPNKIQHNVLDIFRYEGVDFESLKDEAKPDYVISTLDTGTTNSKYVIVGENQSLKTFEDAANFIIKNNRSSKIYRKTSETKIELEIFLDGSGKSNIVTGIGFFDHMLEQITKHSNIDLTVNVEGDLRVDEHHTVEDVGICLGEGILKALGSKRGIQRYGYFLPMDDSIAKCAIDLGGRTYLNFNCKFKREKVGEFPTELVEEFFRGVAQSMKANIYLKAKGKNEHHKIEAMFKAFAKALNEALKNDKRNNYSIPSTKGII